MMTAKQGAFGFTFWLGWIFWFAVSFLSAALFWTFVFTKTFGTIRGPELAVSWSLAVFGSWFLTIGPFMRKKEQIWKRLNQDQEAAVTAWMKAMGFFLFGIIFSTLAWSFYYRNSIFESDHGTLHRPWLKAVLVTWLVLLMPFLIWMYRKADLIYKTAFARQTRQGPVFRTAYVEKSKRKLPSEIIAKIKEIPPTLEKGHLLNLTLKDGRHIPNAFIMNGSEILGVYDRPQFDFEASEVLEAAPVTVEDMPAYDESKWLRLDGRA